ncbi:IS2 ORF2 [Shigella sonnei]|nr:IS2 ORF2 [Shigella sonnei]
MAGLSGWRFRVFEVAPDRPFRATNLSRNIDDVRALLAHLLYHVKVLSAMANYRLISLALTLERKPAVPPSKRAHTGRVAVKESNQRWCSDGFEFRCDNGEKLRVTFALDCCDREALHWAVTTGGFNSETVQDVMLGAVERRFGNELPASPVEWLTDNGSCYRANETRQFARMLGLEPKSTAVRSPESNGIAESFVKTIKRDYISIMPKPDGLTAASSEAGTTCSPAATAQTPVIT